MTEMVNSAGRGTFAATDDGAALERRLLRSMCVVVALAVLISAPLAPWRVTTGLLLGGVLSFLNHHWLRTSLRAVFAESDSGARPKLKVARYILRYFVVAAIVASAYALGLISIAATLAGLCAFVAAVMVEAFVQLYFAIVHREET